MSFALSQIEEESKASEAREDGAVADASQVPEAKAEEDKEDQKDGKKKKNRCASCNKKIGLTGK